MSIKTYTHYSFEHDEENTFPLPFNPEGEPEHVYVSANGLKAVLAFMVPDDSPQDPIVTFDCGEFYQFNHNYIHEAPRPSLEEFKRIIRANPGRVFTVCTSGYGYAIDSPPLTPKDCRGKKDTNGEDCKANDVLEDADGYYICPEDATDPASCAESTMETYSAFCTGDVYGVCVWTYERASIAEPWGEPDRDQECWGYYTYEYASEECKAQFESMSYPDERRTRG